MLETNYKSTYSSIFCLLRFIDLQASDNVSNKQVLLTQVSEVYFRLFSQVPS